ncbi:MAG: GNAT family N-acetyltransferase [Actinomycetota bacterium]
MDPDIVIVELSGATLPDMTKLCAAAASEGHDFVQRTLDDWNDGANRFDRPRERFLLARHRPTTIAMCGLNVDPYLDDLGVARLRHLYVAPDHRRDGIGQALVDRLVADAGRSFARIRLRTTRPAADAFYVATGWTRVDEPFATHAIELGPPVPSLGVSAADAPTHANESALDDVTSAIGPRPTGDASTRRPLRR